jgi:pimeloyl-ACP methyl ester carboxylesterase
VLLVGGTGALVRSLDAPAAYLRERGYEVSTMELSYSLIPLGLFPGTAPMSESAAAIGRKVDAIRAARCAGQTPCNVKVDIVGHSQGALAARYYTRFIDPGQTRTGTMISLGGPNWGDQTALACFIYPACLEMLTGSPFLDKLNAGDPTPGDVRYYHLYSTTAVWESKDKLTGAENVAPQDFCPTLKLDHVNEWRSGPMMQLIDRALQGKRASEMNTPEIDCNAPSI